MELSNRTKTISVLVLCFSIALVSNVSFAQIQHDKVFLASLKLFNPDTIAIVLDELMLTAKRVDCLEIIDLNHDGFGINDFLKVHPSGVGMFLSEMDVTEKVRKILYNLPPPLEEGIILEDIKKARDYNERFKTPESSILVTLLEILSKSYKGKDVKLMLEQTSEGFKFELSNFDPDLAEYHAPLLEDGIQKLVEKMGSDQVMRAFFENLMPKYMHELVVVREVRIDTVYVPSDKRKGN